MAKDNADRDRSPARQQLSEQVTAFADVLLSILALAMLALLLVEFTGVAPQWSAEVALAQTAIWAIFVLAFVIELSISPSRREYLRTHWLVLLSLALPFLRVFRLFRAFRVLRATRAVRTLALGRLLTTLNRARGALAQFVRFSQFAYLLALTFVVTIAAAAGALLFERDAPASTVRSFGDALWWASTLVTTVGAQVELTTLEGRVLSVLLRLFGVSVIGYLTARLAAFLLRRDGRDFRAREASDEEWQQLHEELRELRRLLSTRETDPPVPAEQASRRPTSRRRREPS